MTKQDFQYEIAKHLLGEIYDKKIRESIELVEEIHVENFLSGLKKLKTKIYGNSRIVRGLSLCAVICVCHLPVHLLAWDSIPSGFALTLSQGLSTALAAPNYSGSTVHANPRIQLGNSDATNSPWQYTNTSYSLGTITDLDNSLGNNFLGTTSCVTTVNLIQNPSMWDASQFGITTNGCCQNGYFEAVYCVATLHDAPTSPEPVEDYPYAMDTNDIPPGGNVALSRYFNDYGCGEGEYTYLNATATTNSYVQNLDEQYIYTNGYSYFNYTLVTPYPFGTMDLRDIKFTTYWIYAYCISGKTISVSRCLNYPSWFDMYVTSYIYVGGVPVARSNNALLVHSSGYPE